MQYYSLNLLPQESQTRIGNERLARFFIVVYGITALILSTGIILLLPTYFFLFFQSTGVAEQVAAAEQTTQSEQTQKTKALVLSANTRLHQLEQTRLFAPKQLTHYFREITDGMPEGLSLRSFAYSGETNRITLNGTAERRDDLLVFMDFLRSQPSFTNVESPVENILKEEHITFTVSLAISAETDLLRRKEQTQKTP